MIEYDSILLRDLNVNKMKKLTDYINSLPNEIKKGEAMSRLMSGIKSGDIIIIIDSYHDLSKLQQQIIVNAFRKLYKTDL